MLENGLGGIWKRETWQTTAVTIVDLVSADAHSRDGEGEGQTEKQTRRAVWMQTALGGGSGDGGNRSNSEWAEWRIRERSLQQRVVLGQTPNPKRKNKESQRVRALA